MHKKSHLISFGIVIFISWALLIQKGWSASKNLDSETNGFFIGISQNTYKFKNTESATGTGWQAGIIQKTEKRPYGYLTGLLYFEHIKTTGNIPTLGQTEIVSNDIVFSLWLTHIFLKNSMISPTISVGPGFIFKIKSSLTPITTEIVETNKYEYNEVMFDLKAQLALGAYIKINKGLYLNPHIVGSYNLLNNNKLAELWGLKEEYNFNFLIGLVYSVQY